MMILPVSTMYWDQRSQVKSDSEENTVERIVHAAAVAEFKLHVLRRVGADPCRKTMIARDICRAHGFTWVFKNAVSVVAVARARTWGISKQLAEHFLLARRFDGIHRCAHAHRTQYLVGGAALEMADESERGEGSDEIRLIQNRVADSQFRKRCDFSERAVEQVAPVVGWAPGREAAPAVSGGPCSGDHAAIVHHRIGERQPHVHVGVAHAALRASSRSRDKGT